MEHLPTEETPKRNMKTVLTSMLREKKKPMNEIVWITIESTKMILLPYRSESLGSMVAADAHPRKRLDPKNPILSLDTQARFIESNQLCNDTSYSQSTSECNVELPQNPGRSLDAYGTQLNFLVKLGSREHRNLGYSSKNWSSWDMYWPDVNPIINIAAMKTWNLPK